ncbi:MAG TPA: GHKL domain-containing protein, partial [Bacteroidetes bacterium]|nr:GHKL domain-containing protein [Bacteroidota bacterium]
SKNVQYIVPIEYSDFIGILGIISQQRFILSNYNEELIKNVAKSMTLSLSNVKIYRSQAENEKNSEIESMIRKIGEEYKPKLINVLNNTELIALKNYNKRESIKFLGEIKKDVIHLYNLTIDLVKYTKKHGKNKQAYNINEIIENALNIIYIPTEIKVNKKFGELPKTDVYYDELLRTFTNILSNSVEAIVDKGTIEIATRYDNINNRIIVVIEDSGSGIDSKIIQDIFSPLFTTRKENAGIGLSLAKRVIEEHGGKIQVLSKEGDGTTIRIVLPVM